MRDKKYSNDLRAATKESFDRKGGKTSSYFTLPEGIEMFKPKSGRNIFDVIPYEVGSNHPSRKKGSIDYLLDIYVHKGVGVNKKSYVCLAENYGKPCPICEEIEKIKRESGEDRDTPEEEIKNLIDSLKARRRVMYNVLDHEDDKLKIFEVSHFLFENELLEETVAEDGELIIFSDPDCGKSVKFRATEDNSFSAKNPFFRFKSFGFEDRDPIEDDILNNAASLDSLIQVLKYDDLYNALHGVDIEEDDEEPVKEDPKKERKRERKVRDKGTNKCPKGFVFGQDCDDHEECNDCDDELWEECGKM